MIVDVAEHLKCVGNCKLFFHELEEKKRANKSTDQPEYQATFPIVGLRSLCG